MFDSPENGPRIPSPREKLIILLNSCTQWKGPAETAYLEFKTYQEKLANDKTSGGTEIVSDIVNIEAGIECALVLLDTNNFDFQEKGFNTLLELEEAASYGEGKEELLKKIQNILDSFSS